MFVPGVEGEGGLLEQRRRYLAPGDRQVDHVEVVLAFDFIGFLALCYG